MGKILLKGKDGELIEPKSNTCTSKINLQKWVDRLRKRYGKMTSEDLIQLNGRPSKDLYGSK
jgi:hypothetical protein